MSLVEQRINIKFCVLLQKTPAETIKLLQKAYGEESLKHSQVYEWHKRFREGRECADDDPRSGRPTTSTTAENIERVKMIVRDDRRQSVDEIARQVGISIGSCHTILHEHLNMHRVCQHIVPRNLSDEQRETRMMLAGELIDYADKTPSFLNNIITGDETWCFLYDPQTKRQSSEWKSPASPRSMKFKMDRSKGKVMLEVFFDHRGIVHYEFIQEGRTVNKELYLEVLRRLRDAIRRKRPEQWAQKSWVLLHDNAPAHRSLLVKQYLTKHGVTTLDHPPYSPDLAPCDFYLFPRMKDVLKGRRFKNAEEVQTAATQALKVVAKNGFQECFQNLYKRWQNCVAAQGQYFEGNVV